MVIMEDQLVKSKVESDVRVVRLRGRPPTGWMEGVKRTLNESEMFGARMILHIDRSE